MRAEEVKGLMEAYSKVYETPEVLSEEVEQIDEAPMTAFQAAGGQAKLDQLNKGRSPRSGRLTARNIEATGRENLYRAGGGDAAIAKGPTKTRNVRGGSTTQVPALTKQDIINRGASARKPTETPAKPAPTPAAAKPTTPAARPAAGAPAPAARPSASPAAKPSATAATKPSTTTKPAGSAMDQWAKANPKLAAAAAEKSRIRGTSQTDNPLMKDMKSKMSMTPSVQSSNVSNLGKGNQSLTGNQNASIAATPKPASTAAAKPTPAPTPTPKPATAAPTAAPKPSSGPKTRAQVLGQSFDVFDVVKGYLLDEGYAETEENAVVMMANMSEEWRDSILESCGVDLEETKKWIQSAIKKPGALSKQLGVPEEENITMNKLRAAAKEGGKLGKRARLAMTLKGLHKEDVEQIDEVLGGQPGDGYIGHPRLGIKNPANPPKKGTSAPKTSSNTGLAGRLGNRAAQMDAMMKELN